MQIQNVRFIIAAITTFSAYAVYVSRVNLSIAIIAMVDDRHSEHKLMERELDVDRDTNNGDYADHATSLSQPNSVQNLHSFSLFAANESIRESGKRQEIYQHNQHSNHEENNRILISKLTENSYAEPINASWDMVTSSPDRHTSTSVGSTTPATLTTFTATNNKANQPLNANNIFLTSKKSFKTPLISQEKFHWDQSEQGHILGAFFYGYILFQIPGARMAESMGAKWILMAASAGSAVISLVFPLSTQLNSIYLLMVLRFVMGLCQSAFFPAAYVIFCRWLPERERSVLLPIMFIGSNMGSISTYILSSYMITSSYGWPSVFYLSGLVCAVVSLLWFIFGSNGPEDNWFITEKERNFIKENVNNQSSENNSLHEESMENHKNINNTLKQPIDCHNDNSINNTVQAPFLNKPDNKLEPMKGDAKRATGAKPNWPKLLKSMPVWVLIFSMYGNEWSNVVLCFELPTYLNAALNFPIEQNGVINSFFQLSFAVASPIMSSFGAHLLDRRSFGMHKIHVRKLFQSLATFGQLACFASVPICGANRGLIIMFMFLAIVFKSCANAGDIMVPGDLSPGTIFAFANSIGNTAGVLVPALAGVLVNDAYQREQWTPFWLITSGLMGASGLIFLILGETRHQDFSLNSNNQSISNSKDNQEARIIEMRVLSDQVRRNLSAVMTK